MSNAVAKVSFLQGQAWAKAPDGTLRALTVGSTLNDDEVLVTAQGARVELDVGNGEPLVVNGGMEVGMSRDFAADTATGADEALLSDASVQDALTVLEQGGDLLEELEETAAGNTGGGGASEGHDFVQLTRVIETTDPLAFGYSSANQANPTAVVFDGDYTNRAPLVTDQLLSINEDEPLLGQIIANDIEGDAIAFTLTTPPVNGVLVLDALTGQFTFTPNANYNGADSFVVTVTDSRGNSTNTSITLNIAPINDAPTTSGINLTTDEDVPVNGQVVAQDIENDTLSYVVSSQPVNGSVVLDPATGGFVYSPNGNYNGGDSFVVTISDGNGGTTTSTVTIGINPVNDAPVSSDQNLVTDEDVPVEGQVVASDIDGDALDYTVSGLPTNGTVTLNPATGGFVYTPNANYNGSDSFVVTISDGNGGTTTSTITIGVNPVNDAPVSSDQNLTTPEDTPLSGQVVATDIENDTLAYAVSGQPTSGTVTLDAATGSFVYTPNANYNGGDSFVVTISDGNGGITTSRINIGVTPVNDAPVSSDQNLTTPEDTPLPGQVVATDIENDTLAYVVSGQPTNGTVTLDVATGSFVYTPNANYNGSDSFVVTISDGNGGTTTSRINIGVTPVNDAPISSDQNLTTPEDTPINGQVSATDVDGDTLAYAISGQPTNGTVTLNPVTGGFVYIPTANYNGSDSFVVSISDGNGGTTTSRVNIGITPVNDAPVSSNQNLTTPEDTPISGQISASDVDGDTLGYTVSGTPANGSVTLNPVTGSFVYTPNAGYNGSDSFIVTVNDGKGGTTTSTINIGVTPVNDAPVSSNQNLTTAENTPLPGTITATDVDGDTLSYSVSSAATQGTIVLNPATGAFTYTPNTGYVGSDSFVVTISDGNGGTTTSTINIGVNSVNDAPVASNLNLTTDEDIAVNGAISATDPNGDTLSYSVTGNPANGIVVLNQVTGTFDYTPNADYNGNDSFVVTISDGNGGTTTSTVTITVNPLNDAPVVGNQNLTTAENVALSGSVGGSDPDGDPISYSVSSPPSFGFLVFSPGSGNFTYTPGAGYIGSDSFTVTVSDGKGGTATSIITIGVTPVNDAPVAVADSFTVAEGGTLTGAAYNVLLNDTDADLDPLTAILVTGPANGSLTLNANGTFSYVHDGSETAADSFTYKVNDGTVDGNTVTVNIAITPVNDAPVAQADTIRVSEGGIATTLDGTGATSVLANDSDAEGSPLSAILVSGPANGSLTLNADGTFSYTHNGSETTSDSFTYKVNDGTVDGNTVTVNIIVEPTNDAPAANDDTATTLEGNAVAIAVRGNDTDPEGDTLTVTAVSQGANGSVVIDAVTGNPIYTPNAGFSGSDSFTYTVNDGNGGSATATVNVTVSAVALPNQAPETNAVAVTGDEDTLVTINLSGTDSDGTVAGFVIKSLPANGVLYSDALMTTPAAVGDLVAGSVYFMPDANWNGSTSFGYSAQDNMGLEDATLATVAITIDPVADSAVLGSGSGTVKEDTPVQSTAGGTLTINDPDAGEADFVAQTNTAGTYGNFSIDIAGVWTYDIDNSKPIVQALKEGETRTENFTVTSVDGTTTVVVITVTGTNDGPTAVADTATVNQDAVLTLTPIQLLGNDTDPDGDTLTIDSVQGAVNGTVALVGGDVVFTPTAGFHGPASFTYTIIDGQGGSSTATVNVTVDKANTAPIANDDVAVSTGASNVGLVSEYFGYSDTVNGPNLGSVQQAYSFINGRAPDATFVAKTFDYGNGSFVNGLGNGTNLQTFLGSDATSLSADPATTSDAIIRMRGFVELDAGTYNFKITADDGYQIRVDGVVVAEVNQNQSVNTTTHNQFTLAMAGLHTIEIVYWDQGISAHLKVELSDNAGLTYDILSSIPTYKNAIFSAVEDTALSIPVGSLLANDTDADGDTLTIQSVQGAVNGTVSLVAGSVVFTPAANYSGPASFTYTISDGKGGTDTATVNLAVMPVNDAPVAVNDSAVMATNGTLNIPITSLLANDTDIDGDTLSIVSVQGGVNGTASISGTNVVFTPANSFEGLASFTYTVRDPVGATSTATVNVSVGAASVPSVVVNKTLLAIAHGTGGVSVKFPIATALVDTDGSETLSIRVSGVPTGASFSAGTNLGGGIWSFTEAELPNLSLNLPGSYTTTSTTLTVQVTSTEAVGGFTATTSSTVSLNAFYTTVDVTTTASGNHNGNASNEYIQGGSGNNTLHGRDGNDIVRGGDGDDTISSSTGFDMLYGEGGNDIINGSPGTDYISGGAGNDTMTGGPGNSVDVFAWTLGDQGAAGAPAVDTINGFINNSVMDVLDLRDLLQGEHVGPSNGAGNLADYLHFEVSGSNTIIHISHTGGFNGDSHAVGAGYTSGAETQQIVLSGVNLQSHYAGATTDQQIITQLLNNNKLITD